MGPQPNFDIPQLLGRNSVPGVQHVDRIFGPLIVRDASNEAGTDTVQIDPDGRVLNPGLLQVEFTVHGDRARTSPVTGQFSYQLEDGRLSLTALARVKSYRAELTTTMIRTIPFAEIGKEVAKVLDYHWTSSQEGLHWSLEEFANAKPGQKARRQTITDDVLLNIAVAYSRLESEEYPYASLSETFNYSQPWLRQLVHRAREQGLLGSARPGQRNHRLTSKAKDQLEQRREQSN